MSERSFSVVLSARVDSFVAAMEKAKQSTTGFSSTTSRNMQKVGSDMQAVGGWMSTRVTLPIVAAGSAAAKLGYDFETAFARMQGLANVPAGEIEHLKESVLDLARESAVAPQELAEALYFAASAGLDSAQAMDAVRVAAKASAAGMGTTTDVVGLVSSALASYGADALDAAKATDILTRTVQEGRADPQELAGSLGRILPIAAQLGVEFEEVGGATAFLSNVFGDTGRTVTAMSGFFAKLVAPTKAGREALKDMGTSAEELQSVLKNDGLVAALELLRSKGFAGNQQALRALFDDIEGFQGALALLNDNNGQLVGTMGAVADSTGALGEAFSAVAGTDAFAIKQGITDVKASLTEVGGALLPLAADIIGPVAEGFTALVNAIMSLPAPLRTMTVGFIGVLAATGPVLSIGGALVKNFESIKAGAELAKVGLQRLGMSAGGATAAMGALGLVALAAGAAFVAYQAFTAEQREVDARARAVADGLGEATAAALANADATDGARTAHLALSAALTGTGEDGEKLTAALGTLGKTSGDALDVLTSLDASPATALKELALAAGVTADEAERLAEKVMASEAPFWGVAAANAWLTPELIGVGKAMEELQDQAEKSDLDQMVRDFVATDAAASDARQALLAQAEAQTGLKRTGSDLLPLYEAYVALLAENKAGLVDTAGATEVYNAALEGTDQTGSDAMVTTEGLTSALKDQKSMFEYASDAASAFKSALDSVFGVKANVEEAEQSWAEGVDALTESFKENGATLDVNTEKGRNNRDAIKGQVDNLQGYIVAMVNAGMSTEDAAAGGDMLRESLLGQLDSLGLTRQEAEDYLATLGLTPDSIDTAVNLANEEAAKERLGDLLGQMEEIPFDVETEIQALIETNQFDEAEARLLRLQSLASRGVTANVGAYVPGYEKNANGRITDGPVMSLIGEAGAEAVLPLTRPGRMRSLVNDPRVLPHILSALGMRAFADGGVVGSVVNSGAKSGGASGGALMAAKFEVGDISAGDYRAYLDSQIGGLEKYSSEWMDVWRKIKGLDESAAQATRDRLADEDAIQRAMLDTGAISGDAYETYLLRRLGDFQQYSADWMGVWRQLQDIQREEEQASADAVRLAFDRAGTTKDLADAERDLAEALDGVAEAEGKAFLYGVDKERSADERAQANEELARARERAAEAAFTGAQARANSNGLATNTPEWARYVRSEVEAYAATQKPEVAATLQRLLLGVPNFASGGYVNATPGGSLLRAGEAGQQEWILRNSQLQAIRDNAGYQAAMAMRAGSSNSSGGPAVSIEGGIHVGSRQDLPAVDDRMRALAWRARRRA